MATADREIIEASPGDKFWGTGRSLRDPYLWDKNKRQGKNVMGKVLMNVRDHLVKTPQTKDPTPTELSTP